MSLMVTKIGIPQVRLAFNHSKYLNTHADKLKLKDANIWVNGSKIKFSQDIERTVRNINRFSLKTSVKAKLEDGRLVLKTNKRTLKVNDPSKILEHLVSSKKIGNSTDHHIQLIKQGMGNVKFLYNTTNESRNFLSLYFTKFNRESFSEIGNVDMQPRQEEVQDPVSINLPDQVHSIRRMAVLHKSTILEDFCIQAVLVVPEVKMYMAEIMNMGEQIDEEVFGLWKYDYEEYTENLKKGNFKKMKAYNDMYTLKQQNVYRQRLFRQL